MKCRWFVLCTDGDSRFAQAQKRGITKTECNYEKKGAELDYFSFPMQKEEKAQKRRADWLRAGVFSIGTMEVHCLQLTLVRRFVL